VRTSTHDAASSTLPVTPPRVLDATDSVAAVNELNARSAAVDGSDAARAAFTDTASQSVLVPVRSSVPAVVETPSEDSSTATAPSCAVIGHRAVRGTTVRAVVPAAAAQFRCYVASPQVIQAAEDRAARTLPVTWVAKGFVSLDANDRLRVQVDAPWLSDFVVRICCELAADLLPCALARWGMPGVTYMDPQEPNLENICL
jgi:hypothetical protein